MSKNRLLPVFSCLLAALACLSASAEVTLKETMDNVVARLYAELSTQELRDIDHDSALELLTEDEREVLATRYWHFDVNVPVVVSLMRDVEQEVLPFWLEERGFEMTDMKVASSNYTYEVWQKEFDAGAVELGISGFSNHGPVYFLAVGPQDEEDVLEITNLFPAGEAVRPMALGSGMYRDWTELVVEEMPDALEGHTLLGTFRGRAREAHLVNAFRETPWPATTRPDHIALSWSEDPQTTQTVQWRTSLDVTDAVVRYREKGGDGEYTEVEAEGNEIYDRLLMNDPRVYRQVAVIRGLKPDTTYEYRIGSAEQGTWSPRAEFTTAPPPGTPFTFIYLGDTHRNREYGAMLQAAYDRHPEAAFYVIAGDVVSTGLYRDDWDHFFEYSGDVYANRPVHYSLGNHDNQAGLGAWMPIAMVQYPDNTPEGAEPGSSHYFRYSDLLLFVMGVGTPAELHASWMEEKLVETDAIWRAGLYHFPLYSLRTDAYQREQQAWEPVWREHGFDLMLTGHWHYYSRSAPLYEAQRVDSLDEGVIYLMSIGCSLGRHHEPETLPDFLEKFISGDEAPYYQVIHVDGNRLEYRSYDADGNLLDEMDLEK